MSVTVVIGAQFGDEGKGKIVDVLAADADYVIRFQGGPNAGHTSKVGERTAKTHHIPSGVFRNCQLVVGQGTLVDPKIILEEIAALATGGVDLTGRLTISKDCHLILPYHKILEQIFAQAKKKYGSLSHQTTGRGIGPAFADKAQYLGVKVADLYRPKILREKLRVNMIIHLPLIWEHHRANFDQSLTLIGVHYLEEYLAPLAEALQPYVGETVALLHDALDKGAHLLLEGAQGTFLDVDHGFYPFVTASNTVAGAVNAGAGIPPRAISRVIGVAKAYVTRVGDGPLPTEMAKELADAVREKGAEFGTTTGRPRRIGWFDAEMVRTAAKLSGFDELALTKIDVLSRLPKLHIATRIRYQGKTVSYLSEHDPEIIAQVKPIYTCFTPVGCMHPWAEDLLRFRDFGDFPSHARRYVNEIERLAGVPITIVSVGPERSETVLRSR